MAATGTLWLIANHASGSNDDAALDRLIAALAEIGSKPARAIDCQTGDLPGRAALERHDVAALALFTGDGTANAAITAIEGWTGLVLLLPGGTANLLARSLHGDRSAEQIVADYGAGALRPVARSCIRSSQGTALIEVLAGPGAIWSEVREGMREGAIGETANRAVEAVKQSATGPMVIIADPALGRDAGYAGVRLAPEPDGMTVDGYGADNAGDYIKQGIALLKRDFREGPHDELGAHSEVLCRSADGSPIALMIDGERRTGSGEERFSLAPLGVNLLGSPGG
ncbi:MAG TPA: diacylglycerol kinase family protein [Novosphingobium sp.]|nr:diacylglycerol kinase family protein [Novosphingobium sp.]